MRPDPSLPPRGGVGLKPVHYRTILESPPDLGFFEVHAENYMGAGGPPHRYLTAVRERYALSLHGVGLSIGGSQRPDRDHLARLAALIARYEPQAFSEHLAWSSHGGRFLGDLLPLPYTGETLARVAAHVDEVQSTLGVRMLLENPSTYVAFAASDWPEPEFIGEVVRRTGCALLLDVSNVHVSATNHGFDPRRYIEALPLAAVREIHLAGHTPEADDAGRPLLIDTHDAPVADAVWALYAHVLGLIGPVASLIERDSNIPPWPELLAEARRAEQIMAAARPEALSRVA